MEAVAFAALAIGLFGLGRALLRACGQRAEEGPGPAGLALALGLVLTSIVLYVDLALTGRVHFPLLFALVVPGIALLVVDFRRRAFARPDSAAFAAALPLVLLAGLQGATAWDTPFVGYDAKAIYGIKAKALLHERSLDGPLFQEADVVHYHGDYPLGVPLLMAASGWWMHGTPADPEGVESRLGVAAWVDDHSQVDAYMPVAALWIAALVLMVAGGVQSLSRRLLPRTALILLAVPVVVVAPWVGRGSWSLGGADIPLAVCLGGAALLALEVAGGGRARLLLPAGMLALGAVVIKSDAVLGLAALLPALVLLHPRRLRAMLPAAALAAGALLGVALWRGVAASTVGAPFDEDYVAALRAADPSVVLRRLPGLLTAAWDVLGDRSLAFFWLAVLAVAVPLGLRRGGASRVMAAWVILYVFLVGGVFLVTPNHLVWHVNTALPRLLCQLIVPAGLLLSSAAVALAPVRAAAADGEHVLTPRQRVAPADTPGAGDSKDADPELAREAAPGTVEDATLRDR